MTYGMDKDPVFNNFELPSKSAAQMGIQSGALLLAVVGLLSGCYMNGNIGDLNPAVTHSPSTNLFDTITGAEFVSGSSQYEHTLLRNYKNISSVGSISKEIRSTTPRGYKAFSSVQGTLLSTQEASE